MEADVLGNVNSILVVGQQDMLEDGPEEEDNTCAVEEIGGALEKGDFEQTLEVSLNDPPADIDVLHSQVRIKFYPRGEREVPFPAIFASGCLPFPSKKSAKEFPLWSRKSKWSLQLCSLNLGMEVSTCSRRMEFSFQPPFPIFGN